MKLSSKFYVLLGYIILIIALLAKALVLANPNMSMLVKPSSFLILANIAFVLAVIAK